MKTDNTKEATRKTEDKETQKHGKVGDAEKAIQKAEEEAKKVEISAVPEKSPPVFDKTVVLVFLAVLLVTAVVVGGIYVSQKALKGQAGRQPCQCPSPVYSPTIVLEPAPSASASASLDKKTLKIKVLNGSGVAGSAGKLASYLKEKGYGEIETGNAETQDYLATEIEIKASKEAYLSLLTKDLEEKYASASAKVSLEETEKSDTIIIVGKK